MQSKHMLLAALSVMAIAAPGRAELPMPSEASAPREAMAYLFKAGAGDVFEIVTSQMAVKHSANPAVKSFASMLIADHTNLTNTALSTAKAAGVMAPPPELSPMQKEMVSQLKAAPPADFDRLFLQQQMTAHQQALALVSGYAKQGDVPALRTAASGAVPVVRGHISQIKTMMASMR